jgi:hypothetical protein
VTLTGEATNACPELAKSVLHPKIIASSTSRRADQTPVDTYRYLMGRHPADLAISHSIGYVPTRDTGASRLELDATMARRPPLPVLVGDDSSVASQLLRRLGSPPQPDLHLRKPRRRLRSRNGAVS